MHQRYGEIVLEVGNGHPYLHLYNRHDIDKVRTAFPAQLIPPSATDVESFQVMRSPSKYPFRPPLDIVTEYRKTRPDRYASFGLVQEWVSGTHAD